MVTGRKGWSKAISVLSWVLKVSSVSVAAFWKIPLDKAPTALHDSINWIQVNGWWVFLAFAISILLVDGISSNIATPWVHEAIQEALDDLQQHGFSGPRFKDDPLDHHRLTLFRYRWFCLRRWPPWGGFMVPALRSGHLTKRTNAFFRVPDRADAVEGVVGHTYRMDAKVKVVGLPDMAAEFVSDEDLGLYSRKTFVTPEWIRKNRPKARSFMGISVRIGGKIRWILLVDSHDPDADAVLERIARRYNTTAQHFVKLLEHLS